MAYGPEEGLHFRLKALRLYIGYTQVELADLSGIPRYKVVQFEANRNRPNPDELASLAKALGVEKKLIAKGPIGFSIRVKRPEYSERLRVYRGIRGFSQAQLANIVGIITKPTYSTYEYGSVVPEPKIMVAISKALNIPSKLLTKVLPPIPPQPQLIPPKNTQQKFSCKDVQLVVVAGGFGSRLAEETQIKPKPMVEIGGSPILWHIVKSYAACGVKEVIICLGYLGYQIKEFFANQYLHVSDVTIDLETGDIEYHSGKKDKVKVTLIDTGLETMTGGRLKRVGKHLKRDRPFFFTYGDGLGDVDFASQLDYHQSHGKHATMTCVAPPGRFGSIVISEGNVVSSFKEKPRGDGNLINAGFFVMSPKVIDYIDGDNTALEQAPLKRLAKDGQLMAWSHNGFWQPMDTLRDKQLLETAWKKGAPWKNWSD